MAFPSALATWTWVFGADLVGEARVDGGMKGMYERGQDHGKDRILGRRLRRGRRRRFHRRGLGRFGLSRGGRAGRTQDHKQDEQ
jgi:hypothetical protein